MFENDPLVLEKCEKLTDRKQTNFYQKSLIDRAFGEIKLSSDNFNIYFSNK
jgi:hypothetical protein